MMAVELIGEKEFLQQVQTSGSLWVAWKDSSALVSPTSCGGNSMYSWSDREKAETYISQNAHGCRPVEVTIEIFCRVWLQDSAMNIQEVMANAHPKLTSILSFDRGEFIKAFRVD